MVKENIAVSIIMSVYNAENYLNEAIDSILNQTFQDFEFIIVEDASTDSSYKILKEYEDKRIKIIRNKSNIGLTRSLNKALKYATGKYIARMDADDICMPTRLEKQIHYMEKHRNVALISCSFMRFGESEQKTIIRMNEVQIKGQLMFGSVLPHPGFIFRREIYSKYKIRYNEKMKYAQDYDFQVRVARKFKIACLPDILIKYRVSDKQISSQKSLEQQECANRVRQSQLYYYGIKCNQKQIELIRRIYMDEQSEFKIPQIMNAYIFLIRIVVKMNQSKFAEKKVISEIAVSYISKLNRVIKGRWEKKILLLGK